jgi:DNA replication and repair protein RecF
VRLTRLRLFQYRNIQELEIFPPAGTSLFAGRNGQGKTNLLEAIYFLGYGRSFRTAAPRECIRHGQAECRVEGSVEHGTLTRDLAVSISQSEKQLFVLGKPSSLEEFVGNLHLLAFTQEHLGVVRGGPAERRAFLDRAMVTLYPGHVACLAAYGRALRQRNSILASARDGRAGVEDALLDSWDEAVIQPGARIVCNRRRYVGEMKRELPQGLFDDEILKMHYCSSIAGDAAEVPLLEEDFRRRLREARESDRRNGYTSVGPHRDDLKLYVNGKSLPDFGSAGQQRSGLLALYFAQMEIHRKFHGFYPVFLVDDAEAELDRERLKTFLDYLSQRTQTFLTSAKGFLLTAMADGASHFEICKGAVRPLERDE